ncbi:two-component sensor histidine kinase [Novosphingobium sp. TCA1]|nr:two-component sensor histidine kinase [Novosphingobium sp. TCA1]
MTARRYLIPSLCLCVLLMLGGAVVWIAGGMAASSERTRLERNAAAAAVLREAYLESEIERFRLLPVALSDDSDIVAGLAGSQAALRQVARKLETLAVTTGAAQIYLLDARGTTLASSNASTPRSFLGQNYAFRNYFRSAARQGAGAQFALGTVSERPGLYLAQRTRGGGYIVVKLEFEEIERKWARLGEITFVTGPEGIVLITSRPQWRFTTTRPLSPMARRQFRAELQSGKGSLARTPLTHMESGIVRLDGGARAGFLWTSEPMAMPGWHLNLLTSTDSVDRAARTARISALLALVVLAGLGWIARDRALRRAERAALAAARTGELEALVAERTRELRREMEERAAGEERAEALREGLRQANRLASLGQITAGIAHETAQPVAAIRAYAANGRQLLERGDTASVVKNLTTIERLTERIGRVTAELRGFSRKATGAISAIPLRVPVEGSLLILRSRMSGVELTISEIPDDLHVMADAIRLEQVLVNLLQNALEALDTISAPAIAIDVEARDERVLVRVRDNGPGIPQDMQERLFTPFATSRPAGLGLGLVIASDIMADLGGGLRLVPVERGACFEMELRRA